jgi:hypothetical protein
MNTKEFICDSLVNHFSKCHTDKYGQVSVMCPSLLFGERLEEVKEFIKTNKVISIILYGGRFGQYYGISTYGILDKDIYQKCQNALENNPNYIYAMTH